MEATRPLTADRVTSALVEDGVSLVKGLGANASTRTAGDASLMITSVAVPTLNGVLTVRATAAEQDVRVLLDIVARKDLPHSILLRPGCGNEVVRLAQRRGMVEDEPVPLMALQLPSDRIREGAQHAGLSIRILDPDEAGIHAAIAAEGFGAPLEMFEELMPRGVLAQRGNRVYVGSVDGQDVVTAFGSTSKDHVGIFNVATPVAHRGRGYGTAITARAALDGFNSGATFAYLQSSPAGLRIYESLGFRTLETWTVWVTPPAQPPVA